eukprot:UN23522
MKMVNHPNAVKLYEVCEKRDRIVLVMDLCTGGHLLSRITKDKQYCESTASNIIKQLAGVLKYLHHMGITHRDLKPENILFVDDSKYSQIKVTDFGLSKYIRCHQQMQTACGTPTYVAPEVLYRQGYSNQVDMWSVGVILYVLLSGYPPFYGSTLPKLIGRIKRAEYNYNPAAFKYISQEAKNVINNLLQKDPNKRYTAADLLKCEWLNTARNMSG